MQDRVVYVVSLLLPGIEHHFFIRVVGVQGGHHSLDRIVEQHRADTDVGHLALWFVQVGRAEEGFVLSDRFALVVEYGAA